MRRHAWLPTLMGILLAAEMAFSARAAISQAPTEAATIQADGFDSPYTAPTGAEFVSACKSDQLGCDGKVANVLMSGMRYPPTTHICLSGPSYARAVAPWLNAHPEIAALKANEAISLALSELYKCGPPNNY